MREKELSELLDLITTNETYFFREDYQLRAFTDEIIPEIRKAGGLRKDRTLRIWCAGCSTGEEPYTVGMLALDNGITRDFKVEIFASDISNRVLGMARKGEYRKPSFRATDPRYIRMYFEEAEGKLKVREEVRGLVNFLQLNLLDSGKISLLVPHIDVIFCRNVIMYFHKDAKRKAAENFFDVLEPGGYLLLGHSESLVNVTPKFMLRHLKNDMVYQKPRRTQTSGTTVFYGDTKDEDEKDERG